MTKKVIDRIEELEALGFKRWTKNSKTYIDIKTEKVFSDNDLLRGKAAEISGCETA